MKKRIVVLLLAIAAFGVLPTAQASGASGKKLPPACVVKHIGWLNIQVGYCP